MSRGNQTEVDMHIANTHGRAELAAIREHFRVLKQDCPTCPGATRGERDPPAALASPPASSGQCFHFAISTKHARSNGPDRVALGIHRLAWVERNDDRCGV